MSGYVLQWHTPTMRTPREIDAEIATLKQALNQRRWNVAAREQIEGQVEVLEKRMEADEVEVRWYCDESTEGYCDGDNDLWAELDQTARWLAGDDGYDPPSKGLG